VENNNAVFHEKSIRNLDALKLAKVLERKNPYLFKAKNIFTAEQIVQALVDAHTSSSEEDIFGDWLESLAIFINNKVTAAGSQKLPELTLSLIRTMYGTLSR